MFKPPNTYFGKKEGRKRRRRRRRSAYMNMMAYSYKMPSGSNRGNLNNVANMDIFADDVIDPELYGNQGSSDMVDSIPGSNALTALQSYGSALQSPSTITVQNSWKFDKQNTSEFQPNTPKCPFPVDYGSDTFSTPQDASTSEQATFGNLNLNSVDEEDEFLYGDSSSLPEEPIPVKEVNVDSSINKPNSGWSDEDDFYVESVIPKNVTSSSAKKNQFVWNVQSKKKDDPKVPPKKSVDEISSTSAGRNVFVEESSLDCKLLKSSAERSVSAPKGDLKLQVSIKNTCEIDRNIPDKITEVPKTGPKSKYHAAAELLRKQAIEKSKLRSKTDSNVYKLGAEKPNNRPGTFKQVSNFDPTNKRTVILPKNSKKISLDKPGLNVDAKASNTGDLRRPAKHFFQADFDEINDYLPDVTRKNPHSPIEYAHELKSYQNFKDLSSSRHGSPPFESPRLARHRSRSPSFGSPQHRSRPHSRSPSFGSHSRHRSPFSARNRSPGYRPRYKSPHEYSRRHYSRSPIRKSREKSPGYYRHRSRSRNRSRSPEYRRSRDYSPRAKYPKTIKEKSKKVAQKSSVNKNKKSRGSSDDSFCSLSFESRSASSDSLYEEKLAEKKKIPKNVEKSKEDLRNKLKAKSEMSQNVSSEKPIAKPCDISPLKSENIPENLNIKNVIPAPEETDNDLFKNLNEEEKKMLNMYNQLESMNFLTELIRTQHTSKLEDTFPIPTVVDPFSNVSDDSHIFNEPNEQNLSMPYPQMFPFNPAVPSVPFPPDNSYPPIMSSAIIPPPVEAYTYPPITTPPVNIYPPTATPPVHIYSPTVEIKQTKKSPSARPPATLRSIPVSDSFSTPSTNVKDPQLVTKMTQKKHIESSSKIHEKRDVREQVIERVTSKTKVEIADVAAEKSVCNKNLKVLTAAEVRSKENKSSWIETYKKLKAERQFAQSKVNSSVSAIIEMRNLIDHAKTKNYIDISEKAIYGKCKSVLATSTDTMNKFIKAAKHCDEELSKFKEKLPAEVQSEVAKIKTEEYKEPGTSSAENYLLFDPGKHSCYFCNKQYPNISTMMEHLLSSEHAKNADSTETEWIEEFRRKPKSEAEVLKNALLQPVLGIDFMKPTSGFFCTLCKEYCLDVLDAEMHLKDSVHFIKFKNFTRDNPLYESKCLVKRLVKYAVSTKEKRKKEVAENEEKTAKRKKEVDAAQEKIKEMLKDRKIKEKKVEELEEANSDNVESKHKKNSAIKLTLSGDKDKSKSSDDKKSLKDTKTLQRVVYIGKAPNYKGRPKPWYKRETFSEKKHESDTASPSDRILKQLKERISALPSTQNLSVDKSSPLKQTQCTNVLTKLTSPTIQSKAFYSEAAGQAEKKMLSQEDNIKTSLTKDESVTKKNNMDNNSKGFIGLAYKSTSGHSSGTMKKDGLDHDKNVSSENKSIDNDIENNTKSGLRNVNKMSKSYPDKDVGTKSAKGKCMTATVENDGPKNKNPTVNQAIQNILYGTDSSALPHISLSEIKLPKSLIIPKTPTKHPVSNKSVNEPTPMDISPTREDIPEVPTRPRTEEEKDFYILGIHKDDMKPLAVPVPPPMSVLGYYSGPSNVAHSVPPNYIFSKIPPPGYDRNVPNVTFISTNIPPPGYNVNAINVHTTPVSANASPVMQISPTYIPTNIPPPGYNINASNASTVASGVHLPTPSSTQTLQNSPVIQKSTVIHKSPVIQKSPVIHKSPVMQNSPSFPNPQLKAEKRKRKKIAAIDSTNLITISPNETTDYPDSPNKLKPIDTQNETDSSLKSSSAFQKCDELQPRSQGYQQAVVEDLTHLSSHSNAESKSESQKKQALKSEIQQLEQTKSEDEKKTEVTHFNVELNKSEAKVSHQVSSGDISITESGKETEKQNTGDILFLKNSDITEKDSNESKNSEDILIPESTDIAKKDYVEPQNFINSLMPNITEDINKEPQITSHVLISKTSCVLEEKVEKSQNKEDIQTLKPECVGSNDKTSPMEDEIVNTDNVLKLERSKLSEKEEPGNLNESKIAIFSELDEVTTDKNNDGSINYEKSSVTIRGPKESASKELLINTCKEGNMSSASQITSNDSNDNAESVFNYQAFEKLAALTQSPVASMPENLSVIEEESKNSDTNQSAPPILELESFKNIEITDKNVQENSGSEISMKTCFNDNFDSSQSTPPILEVEIFKSINKSHGNSECAILERNNSILEFKKDQEDEEKTTPDSTLKQELHGNEAEHCEDKSIFSMEPACDYTNDSGSETDEYDNEDI